MALVIENSNILEEEALSDEEISKEAHHNLLNAVSRLYKKQRIEAPKRREPVQEISEFTLSSGIEGEFNAQTVNINELLGDLKERATHRDITKKVKFAQRKAKKLSKPLEKLQEQKITRTVGYENVKKQLNQWSSIVERNKLATQLIFPLEQEKINTNSTYDFLTTFKEPSELEKEMAKVLNQSQVVKEERSKEKEQSRLSLEEMIERRNMTAKLRARESYRIAKAVRQNKIKSKKYHQILKKERIKKELQDFEKLQKTDPEAALEKLEQIERARAKERISLRHRNTGKWAKSKAIRAKYDTEARIQLAEQLSKSRDLTRKLKGIENSSSENETEDENCEDEENRNKNATEEGKNSVNNPWVSEYNQFVNGYEKFTEHIRTEANDTNKGEIIYNSMSDVRESIGEKANTENFRPQLLNKCKNVITEDVKNKSRAYSLSPINLPVSDKINSHETTIEIPSSKNTSLSSHEVNESLSEEVEVVEPSSLNDIGSKSKSLKHSSINNIFEEVEDVLQNHALAGLERLKSNLKSDKFINENDKQNEKEETKFEFKSSSRLHDIDSALIEVAEEGISSGVNDLQDLKEKLNMSEKKIETEPQIDPDKHINIKSQKLSSELPDFEEYCDDSEEEKQKKLNLMEAFAEDDIVDQFRQEKKGEASSKPKVIDLEMPGWGSWGRNSVEKKSKRKTRRLMIKLPRLPRKDKKKPNVIINEDPVPKLREQLVSELPYPFTSVKDFEASIRAPIGKNWVTEKGFKKLTAPSVITKKGTIIEPMSNSMLVRNPKNRVDEM